MRSLGEMERLFVLANTGVRVIGNFSGNDSVTFGVLVFHCRLVRHLASSIFSKGPINAATDD
jgi:hypothetical protein